MHYQDSFAWFITQMIFLQGCMKCHKDIFQQDAWNITMIFYKDAFQQKYLIYYKDTLERYFQQGSQGYIFFQQDP